MCVNLLHRTHLTLIVGASNAVLPSRALILDSIHSPDFQTHVSARYFTDLNYDRGRGFFLRNAKVGALKVDGYLFDRHKVYAGI